MSITVAAFLRTMPKFPLKPIAKPWALRLPPWRKHLCNEDKRKPPNPTAALWAGVRHIEKTHCRTRFFALARDRYPSHCGQTWGEYTPIAAIALFRAQIHCADLRERPLGHKRYPLK